jgi:hypothetical protein
MEKILAALEDWDDDINYWLPNTSPKIWRRDEGSYLNTLGPYLTKDYIEKGVIPNSITPEYYNVEYKHKDELIGKKYLYLINILNVLYFHENKNFGFGFVDHRILDDVRDGNCYIVFIQDTEGMSGMPNRSSQYDFKHIHDWCNKMNIPTNNVYYICGNLLSKDVAKQQGCDINIVPITVQEIWVNINNFPNEAVKFKPTNDKFLYLNYSRRPRYHRLFFYSSLLKEGIFNDGTNSFNTMNWPIPYGELMQSDKDIVSYAEELYKMSPVTIDRENASDDITLYMRLKDYEDTFISIVTETLYEPDILFNSEKIWKPLIVGHPFMVLGNQYHLKWLKEQGFKTFDKWIDESYDNEWRMEDRSNKIIQELKKLKKLGLDNLIQMRLEMEETCVYNKKLMKERTMDKFYENNLCHHLKPTADTLMKIWSKLNNKLI